MMKLGRPIALALMMLLLGGCTGNLVKWLGFSSELSDAAMNYVRTDVIAKRLLVREKCWELLMEDVQELRKQDKRAEARALLAQAYVPLTIMQAIEDGDTSVIVSELNKARVCEVNQTKAPQDE